MVPADPTITAAPILPRQNNAEFIGYVAFSGSYYYESCNPGLTWYQNGNYAQCCPTSLPSCYAPTACFQGSLIYPYPDKSTTRTIACTDNYDDPTFSICNTAFIYENLSDSSPKTDIVCGPSSVNWSYYRSIPSSLTGGAASIPTSIPQIASTALISPNDPSGSSNGGGGGSKSKAWIAGAVVGPIVGLALIGALVFFILRSRKNKGKTAPQAGGAAMATADPTQPPAGVGGYTDAKPQFDGQQADPYANQGAYNAQQGYNQQGISPNPQYAQPYGNVPGSPPPQQAYQNDVKYGYGGPPANGAQELGGETAAGAAPAAHPQSSPAPQAAEMAADSTQHAAPAHQPAAELASPVPSSTPAPGTAPHA